jgi:hypothetical protein
MLLIWCVYVVLLVGAYGVDLQNVFYGKEVFNTSAWAAGTDKAISHKYHKM